MACRGRAGGKRAKGANLWKVLNLKRNESSRGWVGAGGDQVLQGREIREGEPWGGTRAGAEGGWDKASLMKAE